MSLKRALDILLAAEREPGETTGVVVCHKLAPMQMAQVCSIIRHEMANGPPDLDARMEIARDSLSRLIRETVSPISSRNSDPDILATRAVAYADALLAELAKPRKE